MDERIARLLELARRVWPSARVVAWPTSSPNCVYVEDDGLLQRISVFDHPRALDMLEAALAVGSSEMAKFGLDGYRELSQRALDATMRAEAAEKRVSELKRRLQTIRGVAATWSMGDCHAQDLHDAVMDDLTGDP
jgi:hypothetical protein